MSIYKKFIFCLFIAAFISAKVSGQAARSPFTTYGIGEQYGDALVHHQGMGGLGVSNPQYWFLNTQNPALLVYNTLTVFHAGMVGESRTISGAETSEKNFNANLNYLVTGFPIMPNKWTTSVGLMPYTNVDFRIEYEDYVRDPTGNVVDTLNIRESGSGGLTQLYWSNGVRITPALSVGLKATYLFGPIGDIYTNEPITFNGSVPYAVTVEEKTSVSDFTFGIGTAYSIDSIGRRNYRFNVGAVYNFSTNLSAKKTDKIFSTVLASNDTVYSQTLQRIKGQLEIPQSFTIGASFGRGLRWALGTEFSYQDWSTFRSVNKDDEGLTEAWRVTVGGDFTPDPYAVENYVKRITYRAGVNYEKYPFTANGNEVKDFGINFGFSLPAGRSSLDLAFKVGKRGNKTENILEENYFKVYFGITFNDQWFIKRKFD